MKTKLLILIPGILISASAFCQDSASSSRSKNKVIFNNEPRVHSTIIPAQKKSFTEPQIYNDIRLGSSSPMYNTYEKNDYGAGAITTNPHKSGGDVTPENTNPVQLNDINTTPILRDTKLGSSSPLYDTYKKNNYGAGAITTNPNKQGDSGSGLSAPVSNTTPAVSDSSKNH